MTTLEQLTKVPASSTCTTSHIAAGLNTITITNAASPFTGRTAMFTADGIVDPAEQAVDAIKYLAATYRHAEGTGENAPAADPATEPVAEPDGEPADTETPDAAPADTAAAPGLTDDDPDADPATSDDPDEGPDGEPNRPDTVDA